MPVRAASLLLLAPLALLAQPASPAFEAASVRYLPPPVGPRVSTGGGPGTSDPTRLTRSNVTLASIVMQAFQIQGSLITGPSWLTTERYEILAVVPAGATPMDVPLMLQKLLAERFGLTFHREPKDVKGYALVVARGGAKLTPAGDVPTPIPAREGFPALPDGIAPGVIKIDSAGANRRVAMGAMPMDKLADYLAGQLDTPVIDMTRLNGAYDIVLYYARQPQSPAPPSPIPSAEAAPDLATAVREQLGLELQPRTVTASQLVIDHIEKIPSPNYPLSSSRPTLSLKLYMERRVRSILINVPRPPPQSPSPILRHRHPSSCPRLRLRLLDPLSA